MVDLRVKEATSSYATYDGSGALEEDIDHLLPGEPVQLTATVENGEDIRGEVYVDGENVGIVSAYSDPFGSNDGEPADSAYVQFPAPSSPGRYTVEVRATVGQSASTTLTVEDPATVGDTGQDVLNEDAETASERALDSDEVMSSTGGDVDLDTLEGVSEGTSREDLGLPDREQATPGELSELTGGGGGVGAIVLVLAILAGAAALLGGDN